MDTPFGLYPASLYGIRSSFSVLLVLFGIVVDHMWKCGTLEISISNPSAILLGKGDTFVREQGRSLVTVKAEQEPKRKMVVASLGNASILLSISYCQQITRKVKEIRSGMLYYQSVFKCLVCFTNYAL